MRTSSCHERARRVAVGEPRGQRSVLERSGKGELVSQRGTPPSRAVARTLASAFLCLSLTIALPVRAATPVITDSRIKTFVYNENEVFSVTTHYGYQSNVEFGDHETIDTVSVGDRVAWQIIPAGRRLFIRAMEENAHTNMTIVTNKRAYQFDLRSSSSNATFGSEELTYVVRFFYPDDLKNRGVMPASYMAPAPSFSASTPSYAPPMPTSYSPPTYTPPAYSAPAYTQPAYTPPAPAWQAPTSAAPMNYKYTYSGPNEVAPVKIYDDGRTTYFKFRSANAPRFAVITSRGEELTVPARQLEPGLYAVDIVAARFSVRENNTQVVVYNESNGVS